jgi:hypothetical protein
MFGHCVYVNFQLEPYNKLMLMVFTHNNACILYINQNTLMIHMKLDLDP